MEPSGVIDSRRLSLELPSGRPLPRGRRQWLPTLATAILLSACGPMGGPSAPSTARAPADASARPVTAAPSPGQSGASGSPASTGPFSIIGDEPVIARGIVPQRTAILPSAVATADEIYHAWIVAFAGAPGTQDIHHLTSPDAAAWTEVPDPSLAGLSEGMGNPGALPTSVFLDGTTWVMYFTAALETEPEAWDIWRATAPAADGPWTRGEQPVLRRGPAGAWDSGGLDFPTVIRTADGYVLLYSGSQPAHQDGAIGLATSNDGVEWRKHDDAATTDALAAESDLVIAPGLCGGFDGHAVHQPRVLADGDRLVMAYAGYAAPFESQASVGLAESRDRGATWRCLWPASALDTTGLPAGSVHTMVAFPRDGRVALLVEWFRSSGTDVWLAEADALP